MTAVPSLDERLAALRDALALGTGRIPDARLDPVRELLERSGRRRELSGGHTVVGFFGATGSGKSSLFNAVIGEAVARTHVTRPTTTAPLAAVVQPDGARALLDWLGVRERVEPPELATDPLILLDLPDFDSVVPAHRVIAEALAGQVDVLVWVVDPQKYADAILHRDFIRPLGGHGAVTAVVLNQTDLLPTAEVPDVLDSLGGLLAADGLSGAHLVATSARTGEGVPALRELIAGFARERAAMTARLEADAFSVAHRLGAAEAEGGPVTAVPEPRGTAVGAGAHHDSSESEGARRGLSPHPSALGPSALGESAPRESAPRERVRARDAVVAASMRASGADAVADAVERATRKRAGQATGWPLTAWLLRLRPDPLRRLRLDAGGNRRRRETGEPHPRPESLDGIRARETGASLDTVETAIPKLERTSISASSPASAAVLRRSLRDYAEIAGAGLGEDWRAVVRSQADASAAPLADALDSAIAHTPLGVERSWWWPVVAVVQWLALIAALVGLGWYIVVGQLNRFTLTPITVPDIDGWQLPALMLAAGVVVGIVLGLASSAFAAASGRARRRAAIDRLQAEIEPVVERIALARIDEERDRAERFAAAVDAAGRVP